MQTAHTCLFIGVSIHSLPSQTSINISICYGVQHLCIHQTKPILCYPSYWLGFHTRIETDVLGFSWYIFIKAGNWVCTCGHSLSLVPCFPRNRAHLSSRLFPFLLASHLPRWSCFGLWSPSNYKYILAIPDVTHHMYASPTPNMKYSLGLFGLLCVEYFSIVQINLFQANDFSSP